MNERTTKKNLPGDFVRIFLGVFSGDFSDFLGETDFLGDALAGATSCFLMGLTSSISGMSPTDFPVCTSLVICLELQNNKLKTTQIGEHDNIVCLVKNYE